MKRESRFKIREVLPGSIAAEAGIEAGDILLSVDGQGIGDFFDYRFFTSEENIEVEIEKPDGEIWELEIEKDPYEDLGLEFEDSLMDEAKSCSNRCIFCFIDQLPANMRDTLYFKDDDSRLSFLTGNYVTLTNMKDSDIDRIIRYRMSPINISVHTTNPELRKTMLCNRFAGDILQKIRKLVAGGITVNCQIVLCRGINDQQELDRSISELTGLYPGVWSISVVPVGITRWREGLYPLKPYDREAARPVVEQVERWQRQLLERFGSRVVYLADEFYILSGLELPSQEDYEDFPQIENGVGLVALFRHEFGEALRARLQREGKAQTPETGPGGAESAITRKVSIATGISVSGFIKGFAGELENWFPQLSVSVYPIKNEFFGENVTVTGLLTGKDMVSQLKDACLGEELLISRSMLKSGETVFLDDMTLEQMAAELKVPVTVVENDGGDFIDKVLGMKA